MMNEFESGLVYNFEKLGCKGLAEKLSGIFSSTHVRDSELLSVLTAATYEEIVRIKQAVFGQYSLNIIIVKKRIKL